MKKKLISIVVTAAMAVSSFTPVFAAENQWNKYGIKNPIIQKSQSMNIGKKTNIQKQITRAIIEQGIKSEESFETVQLLVVADGKDITRDMEAVGAKVDKMSTSVYLVEIPANMSSRLGNIKEIKSVGKDEMLSLPRPITGGDIGTNGIIAQPNLEFSHEVTGMAKFWRGGFDGKGTKVAIIDTGVEPGNEMLTVTSDGKLKIVDYKDFWHYYGEDSEGDVRLTEVQIQTEGGKKTVSYKGETVQLPDTMEGTVLIGQFDESKAKIEKTVHDFNNNGRVNDMFMVVVGNYADGDKLNDVIYVDTDLDNSMTDENDMGIYREVAKTLENEVIFQMDGEKLLIENGEIKIKEEYEEDYSKLVNKFLNFQTGLKGSDTEYNFVITTVEKRGGSWVVNLGYDGNGHGSHVAGDAAGNGYKDLPFVDKTLLDDEGKPIAPNGTLKGAAPGAQVIACRVFQSKGGTPASAYMAAMEYSAENGADVVNMSLGGLPDINDENTPAAYLLNKLSREYGTVFCVSAGNEGPVTNSVGTPGTAEWAITVGAYNPGWINYGFKHVNDSLWYFSSRGPSEDGRLKPTIIAPGSMIASGPMWLSSSIRAGEEGGGAYVGYTLEQGTSMASPYTAGTVAAIIEAMKEKDIPYHPLVIKEAIFETGDKDINDSEYLPSEIGGGMIDPNEALEYLQNLKDEGLLQSDLKDSTSYIERNEIVIKTRFDYSEKLSYKPEGLYVRNADIPEEVSVTLTNTKDREVTLNLVKDSYAYGTDWLTLPVDTLTLKAGEERKLNLRIDESKLKDGINSLIVRMDDSNTLLKEGFIPITIINYNDLNVDTPTVTKVNNRVMKPGNVDTNFFRIPYGTQKVKITVELLEGDSSNLMPIVAAPSGITQTKLPGVDWVTPNFRTRTITIKNPVPGTWEVALNSGLIKEEYMANANGRYKITASIEDIMIEPDILNYSGRSGEYKENAVNFRMVNTTKNDDQVVYLKKTNLVGNDANKVTERKSIEDQSQNIVYFTIPKEDSNIYTRIKTGNPQFDGDDIDLALYKVTRDSIGNEKLGSMIAQSGNVDSNEEIYLETLKAGKYAIVVHAFQTAPATSYDLMYQVANSSHGENAITFSQSVFALEREIVDFKVGVRVPAKTGKYFGLIYAVDEKGIVLGKTRVNAESLGTDNSIVLENNKIVRKDADFSLDVQGNINESNNMNNIYGIQFHVDFDSDKISPEDVLAGGIFEGVDSRVIGKEVNSNSITFAVGFLNASEEVDATGAVEGNIAKIRFNAKAIGDVSVSLDKLLLVNHIGDEIAANYKVDSTLFVVDPDVMDDGVMNIRDICKLAGRVGISEDSQEYIRNLDFNKDGIIDYKDLDFIINCFVEDNE